jgi:hypothetical protein
MDQLKGALGSFGGSNKSSEIESVQAPKGSTSGHPQPQSQESGGGGFLGGLGEKFNSAAGGGRESEKNEDYLDKGKQVARCRLDKGFQGNADRGCCLSIGIDFVQEKFMGGGKQDNESAIEQAKDEQISDFIRGKYKSTTGGELPIKDKETRFG